MRGALNRGDVAWRGSLDLGRSVDEVALAADGFGWRNARWPWPSADERIKDRTVYRFDGVAWQPVQRFGGALIKLVPTDWGPPTFEIDGIKMLPTAQVSPWDDAATKVALVQPRGKRLLDCCGGLGYYAAHALTNGAAHVQSFEKNPDVVWLRRLNPWSPDVDDVALQGRFTLTEGDIAQAISALPAAHFDAALHDPPRFGIAGELYSLAFYEQLARVLKPGSPLFHYTGAPNAKTSGRDVPGEVIKRLEKAGFRAERKLDGVFATSVVRRR
ncbi:MAG: class I SAM-dependent methyltransferase [Silanimonas sp.]